MLIDVAASIVFVIKTAVFSPRFVNSCVSKEMKKTFKPFVFFSFISIGHYVSHVRWSQFLNYLQLKSFRELILISLGD